MVYRKGRNLPRQPLFGLTFSEGSGGSHMLIALEHRERLIGGVLSCFLLAARQLDYHDDNDSSRAFQTHASLVLHPSPTRKNSCYSPELHLLYIAHRRAENEENRLRLVTSIAALTRYDVDGSWTPRWLHCNQSYLLPTISLHLSSNSLKPKSRRAVNDKSVQPLCPVTFLLPAPALVCLPQHYF